MAKLDSLIVDLKANSAELRKGLEQATGILSSFAKRADKVGRTLEQALTASIGTEIIKGLSDFVRKGADAADMMGKLAASAGVPLESLSRLNYAASFAGISTEELGSSLAILNKKLADAGAGVGEQQELFRALGISVTDAAGNVRSADQVMGDLAEKFSGLQDGASKAALAQEVFGKSGARLIPLLNSGRDGLAQMAAEADRLGATITEAAAKGAESFNDSVGRLEQVATIAATRVAADLAPSLQRLTDELFGATSQSGALDDVVAGLSTTVRAVASAAVFTAYTFEVLGKTIAATALSAWQASTFQLAAAKDTMVALGEEVWKSAGQTRRRLDAVWSDTSGPKPLDEDAKATKKNADSLKADLERVQKRRAEIDAAMAAAAKKAVEEQRSAIESLRKMAEETSFKAATFGMDDLAAMTERFKRGDLAETLRKAGAQGAKFRDQIVSATAELQRLNRMREQAEKIRSFHEINFENTRAQNAGAESIGQKRKEYALAGATEDERFRAATAGFKDFDDALAQLGKAMAEQQDAISRVQAARIEKDEQVAEEAQLLADSLGATIAQIDGAVAAFTTKKGRDEEKKRAASIPAIEAGFADSLKGAFGPVATGIAQVVTSLGNPIAALKSVTDVLFQLLMNSKGFRDIIEAVSGVLQMLADVVGAMYEPFAPLITLIGQLTAQVLKFFLAFNPMTLMVKLVATVFEAFAPVLAVLSIALQALMPIFDVMVSAILTANPIFLALSASMRTLFEVTKKVIVFVLEVALAFANLWNSAVNTVRLMFNRVIDKFATYLPSDVTKGLRDAVNGIAAGVAVNTQGLQDSVNQVKNLTYDSAVAVATGMNKAAAAAQKVTESFLNLPQGYKIAKARLAAQDAPFASLLGGSSKKIVDIPRFAGGGFVTGPTLALVGEAGPEGIFNRKQLDAIGGALRGAGTVIYASFNGVTDIRDAWEKLKQLAQRENIALTGTPVAVGPRYTRGKRG